MFHMHDVDLPRIAIYVSATSVDHPGWPAAVWAWMFAQWLILSGHFKGICVCFWSYTISIYIPP